MNVLERFSTHVRQVLAKSIQLAAELKHKEVEPIHLFFSLAGQKGSVGAEIINRFKLDPKSLEYYLFNLPVVKARPVRRAPAAALVMTPLSAEAQRAVEKAMLIAEQNRHNYVGTEHLLAGLLALHNSLLEDIFKMNAITLADLNKQLDTVLANATQFPRINDVSEVVEQIQDTLGENQHPPHMGEHHNHTAPKNNKKTEAALDFFATELTSSETESTLDPVVGRAGEIERLIQILCRRSKNNPVLLGEPGVGKTAIVEGLAKRIVAGDVPDLLLNKKIYALDLGLLIAGTIYRGEFEGRLRQVIEEVTENPDIILFIDEIHNIVGAGSNQGTMDAGNILKPALSRGQIHCIGATTPQEFKKHIENDPALERRFQSIYVEEPSLADTVTILKGIRENYEHFHHIAITDEAIEMAVRLADRYISNKFLPDKAIDLIDEAAAAKRLAQKVAPWQNKLAKLKQKLEKTIQAKETAAQNDHFEEAVKLKEEEEKIRTAVKQAEKIAGSKKPKILASITDQDILAQIARITHTAPTELILEDTGNLQLIEQKLRSAIVGQSEAITTVAAQVRQALMGLSHPDRPLASFLFVGESGVGKTELAKTLAKTLYPGRDALIRLNMSEFNESFGVSKLLGSPAGYVGYKESNQFTDKIKQNPHCVLLFDEIDKAHKDVTKLLLQMLEDGEITDSTGKKISLKHAILIMTTTLGAEDVKKGLLGFGGNTTSATTQQAQLVEKLKDYFSAEIINRIDSICFFNPLTQLDLVTIAELELNRLNDRLKIHHTKLSSPTPVLEWLIEHQSKASQNAREVRRTVRTQVEKLIAEILLTKKINAQYELTVTDEQLELR